MKKLLLIASLSLATAQIVAPSQALASETTTHEVFTVTGMNCGGCESTIRRALKKVVGVITVVASHKDKTVTVDFDHRTNLDAIKQAVRDADANFKVN